MPAFRFEMFIKLMGMTGSNHDGEALNALRAANKLLVETNITWEELLRGKVTVQVEQVPHDEKVERFVKETKREYENIQSAFEKVMENEPEHTSRFKFIASLQAFWEERGYLTDSQRSALYRTAGTM